MSKAGSVSHKSVSLKVLLRTARLWCSAQDMRVLV
jgi:hypothetical protein